MAKFKTYSIFQNWGRLLKQKLMVPLLRSTHPPEYKAWGVAIGLGWAMTPLVGIQMSLVWLTWFIARKLKFHFSLPLGIAYTWVTNVFTMIPVYYLFYITGQLMRGNAQMDSGIKEEMHQIFLSELPFLEKWLYFFKAIVKDWGVSMMLGCIPWVIGSMILGYYLTLRYEEMRERRKAKRIALLATKKEKKNDNS